MITASVTKKSSITLRCFKPFVHATSRVLILGSMPGPQALRKQQYYGFEGNHFWTVIPALFGLPRPQRYQDRLALVKRNKIALWDVLGSCERVGALDSAIKNPVVNAIPTLLKKHRGIKAIFINGRFAHTLFLKHHGDAVDRPVVYLPSTSPANAAMPLAEKIKRWRVIQTYL
jgi:hypoxanthine-DNA glycosylase